MRELTLQEIQQESLRILQAIHQFCRSNSIRYSLAYGTMIGAVRHKGFIPWDNDIDVFMPRPDYEEFCRTFHTEGLGIVSEKDKEAYINFCRVYDTERTVADVRFPSSEDYQGGIWVDVFPMDGAPDSFEAFKAKMKGLQKLFNFHLYLRKSLGGRQAIRKAFGIKEACILAFCHYLLPSRFCLKLVNRKLRAGALETPLGSTEHWSQFCVLDDGVRNYQLSKDFEESVDLEFEGCDFKVFKGYDRILRNIYGDYMQLPPENARIPKGNDRFYWKKEV